MDEGDVNELVEEHTEELSTNQIKNLQEMQHIEIWGEIVGSAKEAEEEEVVISTKEIQKIWGMWEDFVVVMEKKIQKKCQLVVHWRYVITLN